MTEPTLSVATSIRCLFRMLALPTEPSRYFGTGSVGNPALREMLLAQKSLPEPVLFFLLEMDRKLDEVIHHMQREKLEDIFPHEGRVVSLSTRQAVVECREPLAPGDHCEFVFFLEELPLCAVACPGKIVEMYRRPALSHPAYSPFLIEMGGMGEEDKESLIRFLFQEERKRIRQGKNID